MNQAPTINQIPTVNQIPAIPLNNIYILKGGLDESSPYRTQNQINIKEKSFPYKNKSNQYKG
jgi:hypothetical protein